MVRIAPFAIVALLVAHAGCIKGITPPEPTEMVDIAGGALVMGNEDSCKSLAGSEPECSNAWSKVLLSVQVAAFRIDAHEVTNLQYRSCVAEGKCPSEPLYTTVDGVDGNYYFDNPQYPVVFVTWENARAYCEDFLGRRLPTEAEWEFVARTTKSANSGKSPNLFPWGAEVPDCARAHQKGCSGAPLPVQIMSRQDVGEWGVHDLAGNAAEWVADAFSEYAYCADGKSVYESCAGNPTCIAGQCGAALDNTDCVSLNCSTEPPSAPSMCERITGGDTLAGPVAPKDTTRRSFRGNLLDIGACSAPHFRFGMKSGENEPAGMAAFLGFRCAADAL